ncbi:MAG: hypothetical protein K2O54_07890 [Prevotella sp.]|nr:hypothetical protein [Prevotella sp.]MDE7090024.1 hypothetical protein [Prevotella sp.]
MAKIKTNVSGTRSIEVTELHLSTIEQYQLLRDLIDSNGYIDETVLEKLRLNIRALLESEGGSDKSLLDLCLDVVYHPNMKALGLQNLLQLYIDWQKQQVTSNGVSTD